MTNTASTVDANYFASLVEDEIDHLSAHIEDDVEFLKDRCEHRDNPEECEYSGGLVEWAAYIEQQGDHLLVLIAQSPFSARLYRDWDGDRLVVRGDWDVRITRRSDAITNVLDRIDDALS